MPLIQMAFLAFARPPAPQGGLRIVPQFSHWDASPLSSLLFLSQTQICGPQRPSSRLPGFPHPIHVHLSSGLRNSATPSHVGSSTNCRLCVVNVSVPTGHSPGPGTQGMLSMCRLAAEYQTQGSVRPILQATHYSSPSPSSSSPSAQHSLNMHLTAPGLPGEKDTQTEGSKTMGTCNDGDKHRVLWELT